MNRAFRFGALAAPLILASSAMAQLPGVTPNPFKLRVNVGYGFSSEFENRGGTDVRLEGPYVGVELPVTAILGTDVALGASVFLGGRMGAGPDADVYRFVVTARHVFSGGLYGKAGVGLAHSSSRDVTIGDTSGSVFVIGVGTPLGGGFMRRFTPNLEVNLFTSDKNQLQGLFFGITGGL